MADYEGYDNSRNFAGDTTSIDREHSVYPFVSPHPRDPLGGAVAGDMAFGTGPIIVDPDGSVTTRYKNVGTSPAIGLDGGVV